MNIIVPLSNLNYYKLELDNVNVSNELIIETNKIIEQNTNTTNSINTANSINSTNKIINQIIKLIKKTNNIGVFDILINILPYSKWIEWFRESLILKYYWDDELLKKIQDINKFNIYTNMLNKLSEKYDIILTNANSLNTNSLNANSLNANSLNTNSLNANLIQIINSFDINYNFTSKILKKRILEFKNILLDIFQNFSIEKYLGCVNVIFLLGSNQINHSNIFSLTDVKIILTFYSKNNDEFQIKKNCEYLIEHDYVLIKYNNLIIKIFKYIVNQHNILSISNGYICFNNINNMYNLDIKLCAEGYQKFNMNLQDLIEINKLNYNLEIEKFKQNNIRADDYAIFTFNKLINIKNIIKIKFNKCYQCKKYWNGYSLPAYKSHCLDCGIINYKYKVQIANLNGMSFFISGIRVKIGLATTLRLLRAGAEVIGTTRYPNLALFNYIKEPDYDKWKDRLKIIQADFLDLNSVYSLLDIISKFKLNGFINMAFRTIRSSDYYSKTIEELENNMSNFILIENSSNQSAKSNQSTKSNQSAKSNQLMVKNLISKTQSIYSDLSSINTTEMINYKSDIKFNKYGDIYEIPHENSWNKTIDQIDPKEIVECVALNQLVPTLIISKIKPILTEPKFIINVDSFEGQFNTSNTSKTDKHIHTNMCKSALNMLIRSLEEDPDPKLHTYSINPGYVTGINFNHDKNDFPLTPEDGASRITWPIFQLANGISVDKSWTKISNYEKSNW